MKNLETMKRDLCLYLQLTCTILSNENDKVFVDYVDGERTTVFRVHASDIGPILGKKGRLISAIREIVCAAGCKHEFRCVIEVVEPEVKAG